MELPAIAMLRAKLGDLERHAENLERSASNAPEGL